MLWSTLGPEVWFPIVIFVTGFVGRLVKAKWKTAPPLVLPAIALVGGYAIVFGDLAIDQTEPLSADAWAAAWGILAGGAAVAGHETAKKLIVAVLGYVLKTNAGEPDVERATRIAELILGKLEERAKPPAPRRTTQALLVLFRPLMLLLVAATTLGCASFVTKATAASNASALTLKQAHAELTQRRKADQMEAARAVEGDRSDPAVKQLQREAAIEAGHRYRDAWQAYTAARFAWLRVVGAIKVLRDNPELLSVRSLPQLLAELADAQASLEAFALDTIGDAKALGPGAPPPAPGGAR